MSYATKRDSLVRTRQDLVVVGVRECQNHYASLVQQLLQYTEQMDNAVWVKDSTVITANAVEAPDGTMTADSMAINADDDAIRQTVTGLAVTSKAFTGSVWLKIPAGTATATLRIRNDASTEITSQQVTVTTTWTRFWVAKKFTGTPVDDPWFSIRRSAGDTVTGDLYVWGANFYRNPADKDFVVKFPYTKRVAEAAGTVSVNVSRCEAADQGDGARCHYSRPTCQDIDNFNAGHTWELEARTKGIREFRFCRQNAPLPLPSEDVAPMLVGIVTATQEIDAERGLTINERMTLELEDDDGPGVWNLTQQGEGGLVNTQTGSGTFWRRWAAIYKNYGNPEGYVQRRVGFVEAGLVESGMPLRGRYVLQNYETLDRRIRLVCGDRLKITRKNMPASISDTNVMRVKINNSSTTLKVEDAGEFTPVAWNATAAAPDYVVTLLLENEKVNVTAINLDDNELTIQRARWGTAASSHPRGTAITEIVEFGTERTTPSDPPMGKSHIDIAIEIYRRMGIATADIDIAGLEDERDTWFPASIDLDDGTYYGPLLRRTLTESKPGEDLIRELSDLTMTYFWINDDQQVTGRAYAPPRPGTLTADRLTDDSSLLAGSIEVDDNDETRLSRVLLAYDLPDGADAQVPNDFNKVHIQIDVDSEEREFYGDKRLKSILTEWMQAVTVPSHFEIERRTNELRTAEYFTGHMLARFRHGSRLLRFGLELKDDDIALGDYIPVTTAHVQDAHGASLNSVMFVIKKTPQEDHQLRLEAMDMALAHRYGFYGDAGLPDYGSATDDDKEYGYYADEDGFVGTPKERGYYYW